MTAMDDDLAAAELTTGVARSQPETRYSTRDPKTATLVRVEQTRCTVPGLLPPRWMMRIAVRLEPGGRRLRGPASVE